jgi:hypothetical protein
MFLPFLLWLSFFGGVFLWFSLRCYFLNYIGRGAPYTHRTGSRFYIRVSKPSQCDRPLPRQATGVCPRAGSAHCWPNHFFYCSVIVPVQDLVGAFFRLGSNVYGPGPVKIAIVGATVSGTGTVQATVVACRSELRTSTGAEVREYSVIGVDPCTKACAAAVGGVAEERAAICICGQPRTEGIRIVQFCIYGMALATSKTGTAGTQLYNPQGLRTRLVGRV